VDVAVWTVLGTEAAADAPVLDNDFERIAASDGADRAAHHAQRIAAVPARCGHQVLVETLPFAHQPRYAVVSIRAGPHARIAARAPLQVHDQQALSLHQSLRQEIV